MGKYLLGTDNGGTLVKAALFTLDGQEVAVQGNRTDTFSPLPGHAERDMDKMWATTAATIKEVVDKSGVSPEEIICAGCTGHGNGLYLVDKQGRPVRNGIMSTDRRALDYITRWQQAGVGKAILPKTAQSIWPGMPPAILAWLKDHEPQVMAKAGWILMCKDYIRYRLTGEIHAELTDYSGTNLVNLKKAAYDKEILTHFGLDGIWDLLPPLRRSEEICGRITATAAQETGLKEGTPVAGGLFDIDACCLSCGIVEESQLCMVAGTWGNNLYIANEPVVDEDFFMSTCYCIPDQYLMLEGSATFLGRNTGFVDEFMGVERRLAESRGKSIYEICNSQVEAVSPQESEVLFLPFLHGSNTDPQAKSCFLGLLSRHNRGHVLQAIYEGVVFSHMFHVDKLLRFRDKPTEIRLTGGAARSRVWTQIFADCFQVPVTLPGGTELGALGAAICAGVALRCFENYHDAIRGMVKFARTQKPDPELRRVYRSKYERYKLALTTLAPLNT